MASWRQALYTGVTNNLETRVAQHKLKLVPGFTTKYNVTRLVWYEETTDIQAAIAREKQIKGWTRVKKIALVSATNPSWRDLAKDWAPEEILGLAESDRGSSPPSLRSGGSE
jgi:putative endonuclease